MKIELVVYDNDWERVFVDEEMVLEDHSIDGTQLLEVLEIDGVELAVTYSEEDAEIE